MSRGRTAELDSREARLRAREQALEDVAASGGTEVTVACSSHPGRAAEFGEAFLERAAARGFVVAEVSLATIQGFDRLDSLVRTVLRTLGLPWEPPERRGVLSLLERFAEEHGAVGAARLEEGMAALGVYGDLGALCRAVLVEREGPGREVRRFHAWIEGVELPAGEHDVERALDLRTAKRALADLSRLVRVLGYRGLSLLLTRGEALVKLPRARRRNAYTLLRELVDNVDGGRGMVATSIVITASPALLEGPSSLEELPPLAMRLRPVAGTESTPALAPPHRTVIDLDADGAIRALPRVRPPGDDVAAPTRALLRGVHGLPPTEGVPELSVGYEHIDRTISEQFRLAASRGSVFSVLVGDYGAGKTHLLLHLADRALAEGRPVLRLNVERADADVGHPHRHLRRLLEDALLPLTGRPSAVDLAHRWLRTKADVARVVRALEAITEEDAGVAELTAEAARAALRRTRRADRARAGLESFLSARDLETRANTAGLRAQAYGRLLLWLELLRRLEGLQGPVFIVDEAENLYRAGIGKVERRAALRTLAFYCGGSIEAGSVVLAVTPSALAELRAESKELLEEVEAQKGRLDCEEPTLLAHRLDRVRPLKVPALDADGLQDLAGKVAATHARVRGPVTARGLRTWVTQLAARGAPPRDVVRRVIDRLETAWWLGA